MHQQYTMRSNGVKSKDEGDQTRRSNDRPIFNRGSREGSNDTRSEMINESVEEHQFSRLVNQMRNGTSLDLL